MKAKIRQNFNPYPDQWQFLSDIQKMNEKNLVSLINKLVRGNDLGVLKEEISESKPWKKQQSIDLKAKDFPKTVIMVKSGMLYIEKTPIEPESIKYPEKICGL